MPEEPMPGEKDPWASLADSLGAAPGPEKTPPSRGSLGHGGRPPRPAARPAAESKRPAAPAAGWGDIDDTLGLSSSGEAPPRREQKPAEHRPIESRLTEQRPPERSLQDRPASDRRPERQQRQHRRDDEPQRAEREGERPQFDDRGEQAVGIGRDEPRAAGDEGSGEGRPRRRRRGRRGGRGRGGRERREEGREESRREDAGRGDEFSDSHADDEAAFGAETSADRGPAIDREPEETRDGERETEGRPRRRRRGRRGGRRRAGSGRDRLPGDADGAEARTEGDQAAPRRAARDQSDSDFGDDEPLPSGYGVRPAARQPEGRGDNAGDAGGRRRQRGRQGEASRGSSQSGTGGGRDAESRGSSRRRGRRGKRRSSGEERSTSSLSRGRRDDFAPVARGYDEDDEGLEFLGVEDADRESQTRREPRRTDEDDVLAESGLSQVLDVPSWVEAIGIVIASNLDARSRPRSDDHGRRDQQRHSR